LFTIIVRCVDDDRVEQDDDDDDDDVDDDGDDDDGCRVLSLSDCRYSLNPLNQTRID